MERRIVAFQGENTAGAGGRTGRTTRIFLVMGLLAALRPGRAEAGAWTAERGAFYLRAAAARYTSTQEFDGAGDRHRLPLDGDFSDNHLGAYLEYGLLDRLTAVTSFSIKQLRYENKVRIVDSKGLGDVDVALRARLASGAAGVLAAQFLTKFPSGYETDVSLPLGNGRREYDARLLWGRGLFPLLPGYCSLEAGYRWRLGDPADEVHYLLEFGSDIAAGFYFRSKLDGTRGRRNQKGLDMSGNPTVRGSADLGVLDLTVGRRCGSHLAVEAGFAPALYGRTTTSGATASLALAWSGRLGHHESNHD